MLIDDATATSRQPGRLVIAGVIAGFAFVLALYGARLDDAVGLIVDDAWYVLLGRAMASGDGYSLVNAPRPGLFPPNPPGFAALLSIGFVVRADFPANVWLLKSLSVAAMMLLAIVTFAYTRRRGLHVQLAGGVAAAVVLTPAFVFVATSTVMSECVFALAQLLAIMLIERAAGRDGTPQHSAAAGAAAAGVMLLRTAGLSVAAAGLVYFAYRRAWWRAASFAVAVALCYGPWFIYSQANAPTAGQRVEHGGAHAYTYGHEFWMRWAGDPSTGFITAWDLPQRIRDNMVDVFSRDMGGIVLPVAYRGASESGLELISLGGGNYPGSMGGATGTMVLSLVLSAVVLLGFVKSSRTLTAAECFVPLSLLLVFVWPQWAFRFVLPLTPFILFYLVVGLQQLAPREPLRLARIVLACVILLHVTDHARYIAVRRTGSPAWLAEADEVAALFEWMNREVREPGDVASSNPPLVHLLTGRKTVALDAMRINWERWRRSGVRYLVCLQPAPLPAQDPSAPYKVLFRTPRSGLWIIEI